MDGIPRIHWPILCGPNDAFITFNWDTLLDRALLDTGGWSPNDGYGLNFASVLDGTWKKAVEGTPSFSTNWKLLKLHGSTNWLVPATGIHVQTLDYVSVVPESDSIFLYWQSTVLDKMSGSPFTGSLRNWRQSSNLRYCRTQNGCGDSQWRLECRFDKLGSLFALTNP